MGKRELARVGDRMSTGKSRRAGTHATQHNPSFELSRSTGSFAHYCETHGSILPRWTHRSPNPNLAPPLKLSRIGLSTWPLSDYREFSGYTRIGRIVAYRTPPIHSTAVRNLLISGRKICYHVQSNDTFSLCWAGTGTRTRSVSLLGGSR